ncbi:MAG: hypothetical protein J7501_14750 [Bdellovibrio sp.]|nr:hypothetical protein [Bdellovibrio sp.]
MDKLSYLYIFLQSNLIEVFVYYIFYRKLMSFGTNTALVSFSNSLTHPIVVFGFMTSGMSYLKSVLVAEAFAIIAEGLLHGYFGKISYRRTFLASSIANLASWQLAPLITYFIFFMR